MPIKLPNRFSRRKSSGNALEELENPPEPSFRVFERPQGGSKSFDGGNKLNRGSGGTNNSSSTVGYNDTSSSSARFSSSSTLPSSSGAPTPDESYFPRKQEPPYDIPVPPIPQSRTPAFSLRAAGRTFSFGSKASKALAPGPGQLQSSASEGYLGRERAMTTSSYASTATPPKLEADLDLHLDDSDLGGFGDMFKGFGTRKSALPDGSRGDVTNEPTVASPASTAFKSFGECKG
ncbi:MAG: hypothetical protein M1827_000798 [Pycnora praestabilis]|nr:MAG: hypothetical protein M1827_000798 [Pycnora praestabilis]